MKGKGRRGKEKVDIADLVLRYCLAIFSGFFIFVFYAIFTPLTMFFLKLLTINPEITITNNMVFYKNFSIEIIAACIGGSAYYLLLVLNLLTPKMKFKKRILVFLFSACLFFVLNFVRLICLILLTFSGIDVYFYHKMFWYAGSTIFVFFIWVLCIKIFKIKEIPFISDMYFLLNLMKPKKLKIKK